MRCMSIWLLGGGFGGRAMGCLREGKGGGRLGMDMLLSIGRSLGFDR